MLMSDMMTREVPLLHAKDTLGQGVSLLRWSKLDALPVADEEGKLIGIFTKSNVLDAFLAGANLLEIIEQHLNPQVVTVEVNTPYEVVEQRARHTSVGTGVVIDDEGKVLGIFSKVDMILALFHEAEQLAIKFNAVYKAMPSGLIVVDQDQAIQRLNPAGERILGVKQEVLKGSLLKSVFPSLDWSEVLGQYRHHVGVHAQMNKVPVLCNISPIGDDGGAVIVFQAMNDLDQVAQELQFYKEKASSSRLAVTFNQIVTVNPAMCRLKQEAEIAARGISTILLTGESGTGKELFAEAIHQASSRRKGPYVKVNCAAVPDNLLESEFFGYVNGAFTGAQKGGKAGKFAIANGGTLFLDEIGDMSFNLQSKLLRVLEDKSFEPIGSNDSVNVDVRFIAATNQDLLRKVEMGEFRKDLYYRLNVINFHMVPLKSRPEDIIPLVHVFLERLNQDFGKQINGVSLATRQILNSHRWPGNVRELKNVVERAVNFAERDLLEIEDLPFYLRENKFELPVPQEIGWDLGKAHRNLDKETLEKALQKMSGNKSDVARLLGISRSWLYEKMRRYDMS